MTSRRAEAVLDAHAPLDEQDFPLGAMQRSYLVGGRDGLELKGPARYYVACDIEASAVRGIRERLEKLLCHNRVLRLSVGSDLTPRDAPDLPLPLTFRSVGDAVFEATNREVREDFCADNVEFGEGPQFRVTVVQSGLRARVHLSYELWLMDAVSLERFLRELMSDDSSEESVHPVPTTVTDRRRSRDQRFWQSVAAELPDSAELPLRPGWRQSGPAFSHRMARVDSTAARFVAETARRYGLTVASVYLAVYGTVIGNLGGGAPHTMTVLRSQRPDGDTSLGNYGIAMPAAFSAINGQNFVDYARELQGRLFTQSLHGSLSGAEIFRISDPTALQGLPYPYAFTSLEYDSTREDALGFRRDWDSVQLRVPQVVLDHQVVIDRNGDVLLGFDWRTEAFDEGFIDDLIDRYVAAVADLATGDDQWQRTQRRPSLSKRAWPGAPIGTLQGRVLASASRTPTAIAVRDEHGEQTYSMLVETATGIAERLVEAGVDPGSHVGIHLPRGRGQVSAVLGVLLAGCVYIPLDTSLPKGRLSRIVEQSGMRFVITDGNTESDASWRSLGVLPVGESDPRPTLHYELDRTAPSEAYVIFTSGSTGEPKGVVISHSAALNTISAVNDILMLTADDRILSVSSIGFDLSVYDLFGPLFVGGSVVLLPPSGERDPAAWLQVVAAHGVTVWNSAPALAQLMSEEHRNAPSIRAYMLSGDWIPLSLPGALQRLSPNSEVISLGGATEGAIWSIFHRVVPEDCENRSIPYGKPLVGQDVLVLDKLRRECSAWEIGEIYIAGASVANGYLNAPVTTSQSFSEDPEFGWIYRTGDRGRRLPGGMVEFLGRIDSQVKVNGHRVELGEIESVLDSTGFVLHAAACANEDGRGVMAYVKLADDSIAGWRDQAMDTLREKLPAYMVPYSLVELEEIPLTANGKVDHRRLRVPARLDADPQNRSDSVVGGLHSQQVSSCWSEVAGAIPQSGDFFEKGGSSYDAIRLISLLRVRYGYQIPFGRFVADPTIEGLAAACQDARDPASSAVWSFERPTGTTPRGRVVFFPPVGGGVSCYADLVRRLPEDVAVSVIGLDHPLEVSNLSLPKLAQACLDAASNTEEQVPTVFAGWSFGGALAFEAARIAPHRVSRVVLLDTPVSEPARACPEDDRDLISGFLADIRGAAGVTVDEDLVERDPALSARLAVYRQNMILLRNWRPIAEDLPVWEFRAQIDPAESEAGAWRMLSNYLGGDQTSGGHFDIFENGNATLVSVVIEEGLK